MKDIIKVGIIGDFDIFRPSHKATNDSIGHSGKQLGINPEIHWLPTLQLEGDLSYILDDFDAIWCAPGSPYQSYQGAVNAIRYAREHNIPFIGTCGGFQHAALEYARNVLNMTEVQHEEYHPGESYLFITALSCSLVGETKKIRLIDNTITHSVYHSNEIEERYNCSFGLNPTFQDALNANGFKIVGIDNTGEARILELPSHRFYIATLFQPQLSSTEKCPHLLVNAYLTAADQFHQEKRYKKLCM